jgi:transglutaminase-like putative cysteine protease
MPGGSVMRIPIDEQRPDAHTIIAALQLVVDQFGRDPRVRQAALSLLSSRVNNDPGNIRVLHRWVVNHMTYMADPDGAELVQTPLVLLRQIENKGRAYGDCDDHVVLLGSMLVSIGVPARVAGVKLGNSPVFNHVVVEVPVNGSWKVLDPCAKNTATPLYGERLIAG